MENKDVKIAIIGAGLAGLSCAHELERYGVKPVIYERNSFIGEAYPHVGAALEIAMRPEGDPVVYLKKSFGIDLEPLNTVKSVIHHSPKRTTVIRGCLGYFFERSKENRDIKKQIFSSLRNTSVLFGMNADYELLSGEYDYVVAANGDHYFANELGCWSEWINTHIRGAVVLGDFDPNEMVVWLNRDYCKNGYAYLCPFSRSRGSLSIVVPDVGPKELDAYWELFLSTENIRYRIIEEFTVNHSSGFVYPHKVGNVLLAGNAGGMLDPFLGFGVAASIISGVLAARSIIENRDYERLLSGLVRKNLQFYEFRKAFDRLDNGSYDLLVQAIGLPVIKHLTYYTPLNVVKYGAGLMRLKSRK